MTGKPKNQGYSRGMYRTHIQLDQYELNDQLKMTKKKEVSLVISPFWQILENSSRSFSEISVFRGVTQMDFWKTRPVFFEIHIWMSFPEIGLARAPKFLN